MARLQTQPAIISKLFWLLMQMQTRNLAWRKAGDDAYTSLLFSSSRLLHPTFSWRIQPTKCTQLHGNFRWVVCCFFFLNGTRQQDAYIIKWNHVQMKLLSQPIKVNYQRKREGPCPKLHRANERHHFWKWRGNSELHLSARDRARRREGEKRERERWNTTLTT